MSARQLRLLVIALVGLLVLWGTSRLLSRGSDVVRGSLAFPGITAGSADSVVITHGADTVRLARAGERWTMNGYPASLQAVQDLFLALRDSAPPEVAAISPTSFARMGVDSTGGWWVHVSGAGREALRLVIGGGGTEYGTGYLRRPGSDTVFLWRGRLPELVRRPAEQWRDHRIAAVIPDSVRRIAIERGARRYELSAEPHGWRLAQAAADSAKVAAFLGRFRDLEAAGFATPAQADSALHHAPRRRVTLRGTSGGPLLALTIDSTASGYWVRREGDSTVYRMDSWNADPLTPADSTFRAAPRAAASPAARPPAPARP